jgi:hypothetical protein
MDEFRTMGNGGIWHAAAHPETVIDAARAT